MTSQKEEALIQGKKRKESPEHKEIAGVNDSLEVKYTPPPVVQICLQLNPTIGR